MDKETIKYYVEDRIEKEYSVAIESFNFSQDKNYIQIVYHDESKPFDDNAKVVTRRTKHYEDWEKVYLRNKKIKKICSQGLK